jgi:nucleotide-binding universal stress UspA family protein
MEREGGVTRGTVFLGTDFSPASENAFLLALDEARLRARELVVVHVIPTAVLLDCAISEVAPLRAICLRKLEALRRRAETANVAARVELLDGTPHVSLVEAAARARAELVVLGTHDRAGVTRLMFGSVALRVVCDASCPVVVVRAAA